MPAPQSAMMKQFARLKFSSFGLMVPENFKAPPDSKQYSNAFKPNELSSTPDSTAPPLFLPYTLNKYHTDVQKELTRLIGGYMDGIVDAICSAWSQWQSTATLTSVVITAVVASVGQVVGPPLTPLILASGPKKTPAEAKYTNTIATVIGNAWLAYTASIKVPGLPWYPAFAAVPAPSVPPTPNIPCPLSSLVQVPTLVSTQALKGQMIGIHGDPTAQYSKQIFEAVSTAFEQCHTTWVASTVVTNVLGTGAGPGTPIVPAPIMGVGNMTPGGFV